HPFDYKDFEGIIPPGNYGAGTVMIWDWGTYRTPENKNISEGIKKGEIKFFLEGKKLHGEFTLVRFKKGGDNSWLLIRKKTAEGHLVPRDHNGRKALSAQKDVSAVSGKTMEEIAGGNKNLDLENISGVKKSDMPDFVRPMAATLVEKPFDKKGWIFETKWDGYRVIAVKKGKTTNLFSRNRKNFNELFSPILESLEKIPGDFILDGEVVAADRQGKTDFQMLQNYLTERKGALIFYVFDILHLAGYDLQKVELRERKNILEELLRHSMSNSRSSRRTSNVRGGVQNIKISGYIEEKGEKLFESIRKTGSEGIIAKNLDSAYQSGIRSPDWLKIKAVQMQEAVIAGFTEPRGGRKKFGALILGVYEKGELIYAGHTGTGFSEKTLDLVYAKMKPLAISKSAFKKVPKTNEPATWLKPELVAEIKFSEWTNESIMRHPVFLGLREDKNPTEAIRESSLKPGFREGKNKKSEIEVEISGKKLKLTNPDKVYWPDEGHTKGDMIEYYRKVSRYILPHLKDRPQSLHRFPDGISGESFFQKDMKDLPEWVETVKIRSDSGKRMTNYMLCQDEAALVYMANLGSIEINPWNSRVNSLDNPDYMVLDIDPGDIAFTETVRVALETKKVLDQIGIKGFCKTSGSRGLHIYVPLRPGYDYDQVKEFARLINMIVHARLPETTSLERNPEKRKKKIYLDFLQNRKGQTMAAPYSLRPKPGATVSAPLEWKEVNQRLDPKKFNIKTIFKRLEKKGDLWKGMLKEGDDLSKALEKIKIILKKG
ncbi:MAG TPA: DNA ligase D, partial [Candidatus Moranbacteria bacterium]|nr:DNA ligase D [Candidatus Moranbacteria bacterium]